MGTKTISTLPQVKDVRQGQKLHETVGKRTLQSHLSLDSDALQLHGR